ncbi:MAG: serine hydrolase domain-containing protein [Promethearchaeota archaeon]|jgi:CubicO group peptidase (beta-lactamase class C family)
MMVINPNSIKETVDKLFANWDKPDTPGCAIGIIQDGKFLYKRGYGMANLEHDIPLSTKSVFRIASTSKQFTAMSAALLAEQGKLSLDDNIRKHLPEIPEYSHPLTIRHLMHHTSGLRDYLVLMDLKGIRDADYYTDEDSIQMIIRQKELNFQPGEEYLYCNSGYFLLSVIVKRASGQSLREYAKENIFEPLGMKDTHFHDDHTLIVKNRASGYSPLDDGGYRIDMTTLDMVGDGGIFTTVEDLFLWDQNFYINKLGKGGESLIQQILTRGTLNNGKLIDYALGLFHKEYRGLKMVSHGGAFGGFRAEMIRFPDQKFTVICLANLGTIDPSSLALKVSDIYLENQMTPVDEVLDKASGEEKAFQIPEEKLKKYEGVFHDSKKGAVCELRLKDGEIRVDYLGYEFKIVPIDERNYYSVGAEWELNFVFNELDDETYKKLEIIYGLHEAETYEAIDVITPTPDQIAEYEGEYFSEELDIPYKLIIDEEKLRLHRKNPPKNSLKPAINDMFWSDYMIFHFLRDDQNKVSGFHLSAGRVKNVNFIKK